uniref:Uncharacterized protein n=1 Tax=Arundo donax TaxID=35708 RepID=A0A0A8ZIF2_ARUDO
MEQGKRTRIW